MEKIKHITIMSRKEQFLCTGGDLSFLYSSRKLGYLLLVSVFRSASITGISLGAFPFTVAYARQSICFRMTLVTCRDSHAYEPGKQVRSAIKIKNTSKSHVAFKFQTTEPKSCFMRPPGAILAPGESIIATVFKFVEVPENTEKQMDHKSRVKFKISSLKVKGEMDYVPEMFDEHKDQVAVEQILRVVFLDVERPSPALEKLKRQLAEAEAELESRKKPSEETGAPKFVGEGLVIDEWKERRERYLARQQVEGVDSL